MGEQLIGDGKSWRAVKGEYGESEWDDDWSFERTHLELKPDLQFTLHDTSNGNSASCSGGGYKFNRSKTYTGQGVVDETIPWVGLKMTLTPTSVHVVNSEDPHSGGRDQSSKTDETKELTGAEFKASISAEFAGLSSPKGGVSWANSTLEA